MSNKTEAINSNIQEHNPKFFRNKFENALSYSEYKNLVLRLADERDTTGTEKSEGRVNNTKLNAVRMKRWDNTIEILPGMVEITMDLKRDYAWLVLTESWCGDSAQNIPAINKIAELSDNIGLGFIFRDENPELMDCCLTSGTRSIPKLISVDKSNWSYMGTWGPRPEPAQEMMREHKRTKQKELAEVQKDIAIWYTKDKCETIQKEFIELINRWENS